VRNPQYYWRLFDVWVLRILQGTPAFGIVAALGILLVLVIRKVPHGAQRIGSVNELQDAVQALFAGVLLVVLGLELMDTLRNYFIEHRMRVELLISVALIAVARHVIQLDYEHTSAGQVAGMALLIIALAGSYVAVRMLVYREPERRIDGS
jgi:uncharacterized membrane protein (DUF373 family)